MRTAEETAYELYKILHGRTDAGSMCEFACLGEADKAAFLRLAHYGRERYLHAMKEGMRRAAKIAEAESDKVCHEDPFAHQAILSAVEQLTLEDLEK